MKFIFLTGKRITAGIKSLYEEIKTPTLFTIFVTFCCYSSLVPIMEDAGFGVCLLTCFFSYVSANRLKKNYEQIKNLIDNWWKKVLFIIYFIYFNISIYGIVYLESDGMDGFRFSRALYVLVALVWVTPLFFAFINTVNRLFSMPTGKRNWLTWKEKILAIVVLMINYGIWLYAFNPCISSSDSAGLFEQAHFMPEIPINDFQPPFYAIVLSLLIRIYDSVSFVIIVQCFAFALLIVRMVDYLLRIGCSKAVAVLLYLIWGFAFNNIIQMVTLWKDIPYMISITWLTFLLSQFIMQKCNVSVSWSIRFVLAMVCTALFRHNGIMPAIAVSFFVFVIAIVKKRFVSILPVVFFILVLVVIKVPVYSFYRVESRPGLKFYALANDIVGTYYAIDDPSDEVVEMVNEITNNDPEHYGYESYWTMHNYASLGDYSVSKFLSIYVDTVMQHPKNMIIQFMRRNSVLWSVVRPVEEYASCVNFKGEYHIDGQLYPYPDRVENTLTTILTKVSDELTDNSLVYIFAWRTGIYTLVLLAVMLYAIVKKRIIGLLVFVPAIFNALALYAASGWPDYRYYWPIAVIAVFVVPFMSVFLNISNDTAHVVQSS